MLSIMSMPPPSPRVKASVWPPEVTLNGGEVYWFHDSVICDALRAKTVVPSRVTLSGVELGP